jgi:hypothetical protein
MSRLLRTTLVLVSLTALTGCRETRKQPDKAGSNPGVSQPTGDALCPARLSELPAADAEQTCVCPSTIADGKVWGSGVYTGESSLCSAAIHAGAITSEGGRVRVRSGPGCPSYLGTSNNKVSTGPAGAEKKSYFFPSVGDGKCGPTPDAR